MSGVRIPPAVPLLNRTTCAQIADVQTDGYPAADRIAFAIISLNLDLDLDFDARGGAGFGLCFRAFAYEGPRLTNGACSFSK